MLLGKGQGQMRKMTIFTYLNILILCVWIRSLIRSRSHIKVKVTSRSKKKYLNPFKFYVAHTVSKKVVCIRLKCVLVGCLVLSTHSLTFLPFLLG